MTLKLRLAAMMILLLMAVLALQYFLVQREEQALMDRLADLSTGVDESTRRLSRRAHELSFRPLNRDHVIDELFADSVSGRHTTRILITETDSTRVRQVDGAVWTSERSEDVVAGVDAPDSLRAVIERLKYRTRPGGDTLSSMTFEVVMDIGDSTGSRTLKRVHHWAGDEADMMLINLPVPSPDGDTAWTVRMGVPMGGIREELNRARRRSFFWLAGLLGVGIVGAIGMALQFTKPIQSLQQSFRRVQQGDLDITLKPERNDEIGALTVSFNRMVSRLRESRAMEQRLVEAEREAAVGRLAAGVAHEVRNPLNAIQLTMQQMRDRIADMPGAEEGGRIDGYLNTVTTEIARLERLVGSFLDLSRTGAIAREPMDLHDSMSGAVALFESEARSRGIALELDAPGPIPFQGDPTRLATVWNNLVSNALHATPDGGRVTLTGRKEGEDIVVTIADTGSGIPADRLAHVWEPFYSARAGGVGLGLSIVRAVAERHGGTATVRSAEGAGTAFTIRFPAHPMDTEA